MVALHLLGAAVKELFLEHFPNPDQLKKGEQRDPYGVIRAWFSGGNTIDLYNDSSDKDYKKQIENVQGLRKLIFDANIPKGEELIYMELVLHGLAEFNVINKDMLDSAISFRDVLADMLSDDLFDDEF
jgi:magnesium chelatase subunit I